MSFADKLKNIRFSNLNKLIKLARGRSPDIRRSKYVNLARSPSGQPGSKGFMTVIKSFIHSPRELMEFSFTFMSNLHRPHLEEMLCFVIISLE